MLNSVAKRAAISGVRRGSASADDDRHALLPGFGSAGAPLSV